MNKCIAAVLLSLVTGRVDNDVRQTYVAGEGLVERLKEE